MRRLLAVLTWSGDVDSFWGTNDNGNTNWSGNLLPADGDIVQFAPNAFTKVCNNNMTGLDLAQIIFTDTGYVVGGNSITVDSISDPVNESGTNLVNLPINVNAPLSLNVSNTGSTLAFGGVFSGTSPIQINNSGNGVVRFSGSASNTSTGMVSVAAGTLELNKSSGATAISGPLTIGDGLGTENGTRVKLNASNQIASVAVTVNREGQLALNGFSDAIGALTLTGGEANVATGTLTVSSVTASAGANTTSAIVGSTGSINITTGTILVQDNTPPNDLNILVKIEGSAGLFKSGPGKLNIGVVPTYTGSTVIDGGILTSSVDLGSNGHVMNVNVTQNGALEVSASQTFNALSVSGNVNVPANGSRVLRTGSLTMSALGRLDLANNAMIINYTGASPVMTINGYLSSGYAGGAWTGNGIRSSTAGSGKTVGMGEATSLFNSFPATFAGQAVDSTSIVMKQTVAGDTNLNGATDFDDLLVLAQQYGQSGKTFAQGNLNFSADGRVDFDDLLILAQNYGASSVRSAAFTRRAARVSLELQ